MRDEIFIPMMDSKGDFAENKNLFTVSLIAIGIGVICAYIAKLLLLLIYFCTNIFYFHAFSLKFNSPADNKLGLISILIPSLGGLIIGLMARFGSERIRGHGIPEALEAILFGQSKMSAKVAVLKPLSSAISIGSGGPFGAEGPIIMTGGAFGSLIAQTFHLTASERKTLLVAGAAAGMSAIFASPVAAVLLAVELLLFEWKPRSLIPVAIASAVAAVMRISLFGVGPLFPVPVHTAPGGTIVFCAAVMGLTSGVLATCLSALVYKCEDLFLKVPIHWMWWPVIGGLAVGIGGYFQPRALGVGYDVISDLLGGSLLPRVILGLIIVKCIIWAIALGSGTSGGVLAPLLIIGGGVGALAGNFLPSPSHSFWPLIGMASILGGMMRSPFTGAIFALELTGDVNSLLPLLIAAVMGHATTVLMMKRSILTEKVARRGLHVFREYSVDILERIHAEEIMTTDIETIPDDFLVKNIFAKFFGSDQRHLAYPVVNSERKALGVVSRIEILQALKDTQGDKKISDVLVNPFSVAYANDSCRRVTELMAQNNLARIPIVGPNHILLGLITLADLLKPKVREIQEEQHRERPIFSGFFQKKKPQKVS
jgi:chloride channel protein, CIC family